MMPEPMIGTTSPRQARAAPEAVLADIPRCATFRITKRTPAVFEAPHPRMRRVQDIVAPIRVAVEATAPGAVPLRVPSGELAEMHGVDERVGIGADHGVGRDHRAGIRAMGAAWGMAAR